MAVEAEGKQTQIAGGRGSCNSEIAEALTRWSRRSRRTLDDARRELVTLDGCGEAAIAAVALVTLWRTEKEEEEPHESQGKLSGNQTQAKR